MCMSLNIKMWWKIDSLRENKTENKKSEQKNKSQRKKKREREIKD